MRDEDDLSLAVANRVHGEIQTNPRESVTKISPAALIVMIGGFVFVGLSPGKTTKPVTKKQVAAVIAQNKTLTASNKTPEARVLGLENNHWDLVSRVGAQEANPAPPAATFAFRSVVKPSRAIVLNLPSVGAARGLLVLIFQHAWAEGFLDFSSNRSITRPAATELHR